MHDILPLPECGALGGAVTAIDRKSGVIYRCTLPPHGRDVEHSWGTEPDDNQLGGSGG